MFQQLLDDKEGGILLSIFHDAVLEMTVDGHQLQKISYCQMPDIEISEISFWKIY